ncbi:PEP/pyruvate-binding domain-containing protein [Streptomyces sp. NPDC048629]|uniref:PEP/pyruvate-binding domain-containing protein n=1 Tax=Streptomyces sp. NPDC048629 TaxID=3154824 RepID=UPI003412580D
MLLVHAVGGPPLDYVMPRAAAHADVHVLALSPLPEVTKDRWLPYCASVTETVPAEPGDDLVAAIVDTARQVRADAVLTLSEFAVVAVADACHELGLRGPGPAAESARNKRMMRAVWQHAGIPVPAFAEVDDEQDVRDAFRRLRPPLLLKSAWSAGSTAHVTVHSEDEAARALAGSRELMREAARGGYAELSVEGAESAGSQFLLEEIVTGTTDGWFEHSGWGDYVSVEGIVADGTFHPLCISGRMPTVPPFTERASVTPVPLSDVRQRKIEKLAGAAVHALGLDNCATHTEIKLGADGRMWVIETAARFGGVLTVHQAETAFGLDMIGMLVRQLLGRPVAYPDRMPTRGEGAAASLVVLAHSGTRPWEGRRLWDFGAVDWPALVSPGSRVEAVPELSLPDGSPVPVYDPVEGGRSRAAVCYVTARDAETVLADCRTIVEQLEGSLPEAPHEAEPDRGFLDLPRFERLHGILAGHAYVKVVVDRETGDWHILDSTEYTLHAHYIAERLLRRDWDEVKADIDTVNHGLYQDPERRFLLGVLSLHRKAADEMAAQQPFMVLETVEADTMGRDLLTEFYGYVRKRLDAGLRLFLKPANHAQEAALADVPQHELPRIAAHQLYTNAEFAALNTGEARGRLRWFASVDDYHAALESGSIAWYDILAMPVVPDGIPRVAGLVGALPTAPLSHTNVLAAGWGIPNAVVRDIATRIADGGLADGWVHYTVTPDGAELTAIDAPADLDEPAPPTAPVRMGTPRVEQLLAIVPLSRLRADDRHGYGTKAAHLGEVHHLLTAGSVRLAGYYTVPRPPRDHLLGHLAERLGAPDVTDLAELTALAGEFLTRNVGVPEGVALPFAFQQRYLAASPAVQQHIGMLKMALRLGAFDAVDVLCGELQDLIRATPLPDDMLRLLHDALVSHLPGARQLVVRSSSNAEDLPGFSAAGLYDSVSRVSDVAGIADAVVQVWASLFSARSVLLRNRAGIPPADTYMGVVVHPRVEAAVGGVMVTCNPVQRADFRNVSVNLTPGSPEAVVDGTVQPLQHLYNTVEGGGRTVSLGAADRDVDGTVKEHLGRLALAGRLLQGHFSRDLTFAEPLDIEWLLDPAHRLHLLQVRAFGL